MTQPATERETPPQSRGQSKGKGLTRKIGPLPAWGWAAIAGGGALIWYVWRRRKSQQDASTASAPGPGGAGYPGTMCPDQAGNVGFVDANGNCDTSLSGTGLPGGGQDAALLAQIKSLQGEESGEQAAIADIQSDVGEPLPITRKPPPPRPRVPSSNWPGGLQPRPSRPRPAPRRRPPPPRLPPQPPRPRPGR